MRRRILSIILAMSIVSSCSVQVFATPEEDVINDQATYDQYTEQIANIQSQIYDLDAEIEPLTESISENEAEMESLKVEIENTQSQIEENQASIEDTQEVLSNRIRELYKAGGESSYLSLIFSAENFNDLINIITSTAQIVDIDNQLISDLQDEQDDLAESQSTLQSQQDELVELNEENEESLQELQSKKDEQEAIIEQLQSEQAAFEAEYLVVDERNLVADTIEQLKTVSTSEELSTLISQLTSVRDNQIKSSTVISEINTALSEAQTRLADLQASETQQKESDSESNNSNSITTTSTTSNEKINAVLNLAYSLLGCEYVYGATGPTTFDCSGFTQYVYKNAVGIDITRTTYSQVTQGIAVSEDELEPGDLVFPHAGHVGIYVGDGYYINAPQTGDVVKVAKINSFYAARRIIY